MRQIINFQIGRCGNQISNSFWEKIAQQHGITMDGQYRGQSDLQHQRLDVYFNETKSGYYLSRSILVDLETGTLDQIRAGPYASIYNSDNYIYHCGSAGNLWAKGRYTGGAQIINYTLDAMRKQAQICDNVEGFQLVHSLGGGTGSGFNSLLLQKVKELYPNKITETTSIYPSPKVSDNVLEAYNTTFGMYSLVENANISVAIDNQALLQLCQKRLKIQKPTYSNLNSLVSTAMCGITASTRFPGQLNASLRKVCVNSIPFPRMHFFIAGIAPLTQNPSKQHKSFLFKEVAHDLLHEKNVLCKANPCHGRYLACSFLFRGRVPTKQVEQEILSHQNKKSSYFVEWIPSNIHSSICDIPPKGYNLHGTYLGNSTSIQQIFKRIAEVFTAMFRRKAFIHWYTSQGMDEMQFTEAQSNLNDFISQYQSTQDITWEDEEEWDQDY